MLLSLEKNPQLAILIPSVHTDEEHTRRHYLARLMSILQPQLNGGVVVLCEIDEGEAYGGKTTGQKRNELVQSAASIGAKFLCHWDDDDILTDNACALVLNALRSDPDIVGIRGTTFVEGKAPKPFVQSLQYRSYGDKNGVTLRYPTHLNPVRTSLALQVPFMNISFGEDRDFSMRLLPLLKSEVMIEQPIYEYWWRRDKPELVAPETYKSPYSGE